jgi:hypothetical protein
MIAASGERQDRADERHGQNGPALNPQLGPVQGGTARLLNRSPKDSFSFLTSFPTSISKNYRKIKTQMVELTSALCEPTDISHATCRAPPPTDVRRKMRQRGKILLLLALAGC